MLFTLIIIEIIRQREAEGNRIGRKSLKIAKKEERNKGTNGSGCNQRRKWEENHGQEQYEKKEKRNEKVEKKREEKDNKEGRERGGGADKMKQMDGDMERTKWRKEEKVVRFKMNNRNVKVREQ